jgi:signal transduction histidine kinase
LARVGTHLTIRQQKKELLELNANKDKFISILAHDLINSFTVILHYANLLCKDLDNKDIEVLKKYSNTIKNAGTNAHKLLLDLLMWARAQRNKIAFAPKEIKIKSEISEILTAFEASAKQKELELKSLVSPEVIIHADITMFHTIVRNLVSNAIKFSLPSGKIEVDVREDNKWYEISVKDTGIGINSELQKKLFRIETEFSTVGTANEKGSGLGLLICKEFIEKHGGNIWVKSEVDNGATFFFTIPKSF